MNPRLIGLTLLLISTICVIYTLVYEEVANQEIELSPLLDRTTEVLEAVDVIGREFTALTVTEEHELGLKLSQGIRLFEEVDPKSQAYLDGVLTALLAKANLSRPSMPYEIHALNSLVKNAFALPGGFVYVTTGLLDTLHTEAELAAVVGHEIGHIDLGHCASLIQYKEAGRAVAGEIGSLLTDLAYRFYSIGYRDEQEEEADRFALKLCVLAGYELRAAMDAQRALAEAGELTAQSPNLKAEFQHAVATGIGDYFGTHPPAAARIRQLERAIQESKLSQERGYRGRENHLLKLPRFQTEFAGEWTTP